MKFKLKAAFAVILAALMALAAVPVSALPRFEAEAEFVNEPYSNHPRVQISSASQSEPTKNFVPRLSMSPATAPSYYTTLNYFYNIGYGMPNCTAYAYGRAYEILGHAPNLCTTPGRASAKYWWDYNIDNNCYPYGRTPALGAVACWTSSGNGHVAVVERIDGDYITTSESAWNGQYFFTTRRSISGLLNNSEFQGFIYVYQQNPPAAPANVHTVSGRTLFSCDEYIDFAWNASETATTYWVYMWKDGVELYGTEVGNCLCFTSAPTSAGNYTLVVRAGNGAGFSNDPASSVTFRVYDSPPTAPTNVHTVSGRTSFSCDEYIDFAWNASETATTYWVYMWKDGVELYGTEVGNRLCFTSAPTSAGNYTLIVRAGNGFGFSNDPAFVTFRVYDSPTAVTPGDVDSNGTVTISDALLALRMAMGIIPVANLEAADMNGDGTVSVTDALSIIRVSLGTA